MKKILLLLPLVSLVGCGVPRTNLNASIGNTKFQWGCPKQFVATNIVALVNSNGTASLTIGYVESKNDPAVIDKATAGDVARINALSSLVNSGLDTGIKAAK